jgi:hypothetical protein
MGGGSKGAKMRPELPVALAPSPRVSPVEQPNPPVQQNYAPYYMPNSVEAMRQSLLTENGSMPFGVRSPYRQVTPDSSYAAPRMPQMFKPSNAIAPSQNDPVYEARLRELEERLAMSGGGDGRMDGGGYGGGGGNN